MNSRIHIPDEWHLLVECLRRAIHDTPAPASLKSCDWSLLLRQARQHSVEYFLFPWLVRNIPELFSAGAAINPESAPALWRALSLKHLQATIIRQRQTADILQNFAAQQIDVIVLKGSWLSEKIYDEPSQRFMFDIDLLVRRASVEPAHIILETLGYRPKRDIRESDLIYDDSYYHPAYSVFIELHWNVESNLEDEDMPVPDIDAIWKDTRSAVLTGQPIKEFTYEDQLSHLVQHILHHKFAISLKSYLDIALLLKKQGGQLSPAKLTAAAGLWKTGQAIPFILRMVSEIFAASPPEQLRAPGQSCDQDLLISAIRAIFELAEPSRRLQEHNLLKYSRASAAGRIKFILSRIFMPQSFMILQYPFAGNSLLLPAAWMLRACKLIQRTGGRITSLDENDATLENAALREAITRELLASR